MTNLFKKLDGALLQFSYHGLCVAFCSIGEFTHNLKKKGTIYHSKAVFS